MIPERKIKLAMYKHKYFLKLVFIPGIIKFSKSTPFDLENLKEASKKMMEYGKQL